MQNIHSQERNEQIRQTQMKMHSLLQKQIQMSTKNDMTVYWSASFVNVHLKMVCIVKLVVRSTII